MPESASVTDIFGAIFIDPVAKAGGPLIPSDWKRYRDDTWDIEENVEGEQLEEFTRYLNSEVLRDKIKFTVESSGSQLVFLDTKVYLREGFLVPEIYSEPTDSHEYLNPTSAHPPQVSRNNPYSVALRVRRNCSDRVPGDEMFVDNLVKYKAYMLQSGYNSAIVDKHFIKVAKLKRKAVLEGKLPLKRKLESTRTTKINFVTSWDPMFPDINKALRNFQHIFEEDDQCKQLFPRGTFRVAYKRGHKNLKELIAPARVNTGMSVGSNYDRDTQGKFVKCGSCGASNRGRKRKSGIYACQVVKEGSSFKSNQIGEIYKIRQDINCRCENIIYLVTCKKCGMQGVGSCTTFCKRISNYITSIENKSPGCRIEMHFLKPEHSVQDFTITGIVQLVNPPREPIGRLREFEGYWMIKLQTLEPYGMNGINEYQRIIAKKGLHRMFEI